MPPLRLSDIGPDEYLSIACGGCRRVAHFRPPFPGRFIRRPAWPPIMDIIPRLVCSACGARDGFRVTIERDRPDRSQLAGGASEVAAVIAAPAGRPT